MRLWSIHPTYLDAKGLVALWREALLAQKVLLGQTKGYKKHPQLNRFIATDNKLGAIASYLRFVNEEAIHRGYNFDSNKILNAKRCVKIPVNSGQIEYEFNHLLKKLAIRDQQRYERLKLNDEIKLHPLFEEIPGDTEAWEIQP